MSEPSTWCTSWFIPGPGDDGEQALSNLLRELQARWPATVFTGHPHYRGADSRVVWDGDPSLAEVAAALSDGAGLDLEECLRVHTESTTVYIHLHRRISQALVWAAAHAYETGRVPEPGQWSSGVTHVFTREADIEPVAVAVWADLLGDSASTQRKPGRALGHVDWGLLADLSDRASALIDAAG